MTPSRKKSSVSSDGKQITITDEYDPDYYEVVDISSGELDPEVAITLANQALDYGSKNLSSSNRKVKNFQDVSDSYLKLKVAVNAAQTEIARAKSEGRKANFIAIDNAITTVFIKMLDPGSVVREQEYARLLQDMGITERWIGRIGNAIRGGYLTESSRQAVLDMAQKMMVASELGYMKESIKHYGQIKSLGEAVGEGLGEKYAHLATGIEYVLSDGTTFDFKNSSFEELNQLRKERTAMLMKGDFGDKVVPSTITKMPLKRVAKWVISGIWLNLVMTKPICFLILYLAAMARQILSLTCQAGCRIILGETTDAAE